MRTEGKTDERAGMTQLIVARRSFVNAPKTVSVPNALDIRKELYYVNFLCLK
jgi:hypothetical protein